MCNHLWQNATNQESGLLNLWFHQKHTYNIHTQVVAPVQKQISFFPYPRAIHRKTNHQPIPANVLPSQFHVSFAVLFVNPQHSAGSRSRWSKIDISRVADQPRINKSNPCQRSAGTHSTPAVRLRQLQFHFERWKIALPTRGNWLLMKPFRTGNGNPNIVFSRRSGGEAQMFEPRFWDNLPGMHLLRCINWLAFSLTELNDT